MKERFRVEYNEAASTSEAAFILDTKSGLRVRILRFRTLKQLDSYVPANFIIRVRNLPILLEAEPNELTEKNRLGIMKRIVDWYYYTQLNPPPATDPPASGSAD